MKADLTTIKNKYDVVYVDCPWAYAGQQDKWGSAAKFYSTMTNEELLEMNIKSILNPKSVVFMWATCPRLDFAIELGKAWGLHYRGKAFVWIKTRKDGTPIGAQGVRPSCVKPLTEDVLLFSTVKTGRPLPLADESVVQTVFAPKGEHSVKPLEVKYRIERLYPNASRIELFARQTTEKWDHWGDEAENE